MGFVFSLLGLLLIRQQTGESKLEMIDSSKVSFAGFWVRFGSISVDWGLFSIFFYFLFMVFGTNIYDYLPSSLTAFCWLFFEIYMLKRWGQTVGKMVMGIKVVKTDFFELTWKEVLLRCFLDVLEDIWQFLKACLILSGIITTGLLFSNSSNPYVFPGNILRIFSEKLPNLWLLWLMSEMVILLTNRKKRALHDFLAGTVVIVKKKASPWAPLLVGIFFVITISSIWFFYFKNDYMVRMYAEKGDPQNQLTLGSNYYNGWFGEPKDYDLALQWFQKSAAQGNKRAQWYIGEMYEIGLGVKEDQAQAAQWYTLAAKNGDRLAKKSLKEQNDPKHQNALGFQFYEGVFKTHDYGKALEWFQKAASQGNAMAQGYLGEMYEKGLGVNADKTQAIQWYSKGAKNGDSKSKIALQRLGIDIP